MVHVDTIFRVSRGCFYNVKKQIYYSEIVTVRDPTSQMKLLEKTSFVDGQCTVTTWLSMLFEPIVRKKGLEEMLFSFYSLQGSYR